MKQLHLQVLQAEKEELEFLHEIGLINYYTFVNFIAILKTDKKRDAQAAFSLKFINPKKNFLTRIETTIIQFLGHHDGSLIWLMKYQNLRFSNQIQHNMAGILMAHKALKVIKSCDFKLSDEKLSTIKKLHHALKQLPKIKTVISLKRKHQWISKAPLFVGLPQEMLAQKTEYVNFLPDDIVFNEHDKGHSLYILVNGRVDVYKENKQGKSVHLVELQEGSFIGEHALLMDSRRSATIKAKTYITFLRLTATEVLKMSKIAPELETGLRETDLQRQVVDLTL